MKRPFLLKKHGSIWHYPLSYGRTLHSNDQKSRLDAVGKSCNVVLLVLLLSSLNI